MWGRLTLYVTTNQPYLTNRSFSKGILILSAVLIIDPVVWAGKIHLSALICGEKLKKKNATSSCISFILIENQR